MALRVLQSSGLQRDEGINRHVSDRNEWNEMNSHGTTTTPTPRHNFGFERQGVSTSTSSAYNTTTERQRRRQRRHVISFQVPSVLADGIEAIQEAFATFWQMWWDLTTSNIFPSKIVLYRVSVMAIAWERVLEDLCWEMTQNQHGSCLSGFSYAKTTTPPLTLTPNWSEMNWPTYWTDNNNNNSLVVVVQYLSWFLPLLLLVICICQHQLISTTALLWPGVVSSHSPDEAFLVAALVSLLCLEAIFPLTILACTSMFLLQKISCTTSLVVLGGVYAISSTTAGWIRCILYSYIGERE